MVTFYLICLFVGLVFVFVSAVLGGVFHAADVSGSGPEVAVGGHDLGFGGHDVDVSGHDIGSGHVGGPDGHFDTSAGVGSFDAVTHLSPWSPFIIAVFIACLGGFGLIAYGLLSEKYYVHFPIAAVSGIAFGAATFFIMNKIFRATSASSHFSEAELGGTIAEVIIAIPENGVGEISFIAGSSTTSSPARSLNGKAIPAHSRVEIARMAEGTAYVKESIGQKFERLLGKRK